MASGRAHGREGGAPGGFGPCCVRLSVVGGRVSERPGLLGKPAGHGPACLSLCRRPAPRWFATKWQFIYSNLPFCSAPYSASGERSPRERRKGVRLSLCPTGRPASASDRAGSPALSCAASAAAAGDAPAAEPLPRRLRTAPCTFPRIVHPPSIPPAQDAAETASGGIQSGRSHRWRGRRRDPIELRQTGHGYYPAAGDRTGSDMKPTGAMCRESPAPYILDHHGPGSIA
jgi:hypothetical protein